MAIELISNKLIDTDIRVIQETTCPSLSERSTLTYQIGCNEHNDILFRIHNNTGTGKFNREWVPSNDMLDLIDASKKPFSWKVLHPLVKGKSVNTACFLMAALKNEGLLQPLDRLYEQKSPAEFQERMKKLITSPQKRPRKPRKKPDTSKQPAPSKKGTAKVGEPS